MLRLSMDEEEEEKEFMNISEILSLFFAVKFIGNLCLLVLWYFDQEKWMLCAIEF